VLHPHLQSTEDRRDSAPALAEAVALAGALPGLKVVGAESVTLRAPKPGLLLGAGKVAELKAKLAAAEVELVLIDGVLTPVQQRNLERAWQVKILDRTGLILEIFSARARTREGVLQVELAALSYQKTRLVRAWTHLERQRGGLGFVGGPGETQIEADRRALNVAIARIRRQLAKVVKTRTLHRAARARVPYPVVALVGYTNAGKSTLFNRLTGAEVEVKDMLFATLDPTMRELDLPDARKAILSDTVGFISDLPPQLVAAFRATLEEVISADLIVHVRDISHPDAEAQARDVEAILADIGVGEDVPGFEVWNKIDALPAAERKSIITLAARQPGTFAVSALTGAGQEALLAAIAAAVSEPKTLCELVLAFSDGRRRAWLYAQGVVAREERDGDKGYRLSVRWSARQQRRFGEL